MPTGLVMEGGAMRGMFTSGVIDVLMEQKIRLDGVIGVSAGATFGCNYVSRQAGRAVRYCVKYRHDPRFCSVTSLFLTGDMYGAKFCYHTLPEKLDPFDRVAFAGSGIPFYVVCTDVNTGKAVYRRMKTLDSREVEWVRASASMPLASRIVRIGKHALLDGGISDSIPLRFMRQKGFERNVVILTQPRGYQKQPNSLKPLLRKVYADYPQLLRALEERHNVYNAEIRLVESEEKKGNVFVIRPPRDLPIGHITHSEKKLRETYEIGRQTARKNLPGLMAFLKSS